MDKVEIEFKLIEDKLIIINKDVIPTLSHYLKLIKEQPTEKRHIIVVVADNEEEEN